MKDYAADLDWFHELPIRDRRELLQDPYRTLSPGLMTRLPTGLVTGNAHFVAHSSTSLKAKLLPSAAIQLEDQREQLVRELDDDRSEQS